MSADEKRHKRRVNESLRTMLQLLRDGKIKREDISQEDFKRLLKELGSKAPRARRDSGEE